LPQLKGLNHNEPYFLAYLPRNHPAVCRCPRTATSRAAGTDLAHPGNAGVATCTGSASGTTATASVQDSLSNTAAKLSLRSVHHSDSTATDNDSNSVFVGSSAMIRWASLLLALVAGSAIAQDTPRDRFRPIVDWASVRHVAMQRMDDGRLWRFDTPSETHKAAVRVSIGGQGGSGTIIGTTGNGCVVVTNHHVAEVGGRCSMTLQCTMLDGTKFVGKYIGANEPLDLAVYLVERKDLPAIAVSSQDVPIGETVCVMAFGGPNHHKATFRPFVAPVIRGHAKVAVDAGTISGDSGSGMVWKGVLVGVNFGSVGGYSASEGGWPVHYPSSSWATATSINSFLTQCLGPYGCAPQVSPPGSQGSGGSPFYPPSQQTPPQITPPQQPVAPPHITQPQQPVTPPATCPPGRCDDETIKKIIADAVAAASKPGPQGEQGPPGPQGPSGRDCEIDIDAIAAQVIAKIPPRRFILVDGATRKVIDDESYQPGEPIVLDVQQIIRSK
jgi:S1-C subfamily serine protease